MESVPSKSEIKLLIDNALLEQEKRITKEMREELANQTKNLTDAIEKQNSLYSGQIISLNKDVTKLESAVKALKIQMAVVGTASLSVGGLVGFFIAQLVK